MIKSSLVVATASAALLMAGAAFADTMPNGPEPYSAPDPSYTPHQVQSSVTYNKDGKLATQADAGSMQHMTTKAN